MQYTTNSDNTVCPQRRADALVQWLKLPARRVGDTGFEPRSGIQVKKKNFFPTHS